MVPTFTTTKAIPSKSDQIPSDRVERVMLVRFKENLRPLRYKVAVIENFIGDKALKRFGVDKKI